MKLLSVIMPVKNKLEMTKMTITSLVDNTPSLGEIILIDDHSTEDFTKLDGIEYYLNKGSGVTDAWNYGASLAQYPYIAWVNNDLLFSFNWEKPLLQALSNDVWVVSPYHTAFNLPADWPVGKDRKNNMEGVNVGIPFLGSCFIMTKGTWNIIGPIDERIRIWCGDNFILDRVVQDFKKQCKEIRESYIHHFISQTLFTETTREKLNEDVRNYEIISKERGWI